MSVYEIFYVVTIAIVPALLALALLGRPGGGGWRR